MFQPTYEHPQDVCQWPDCDRKPTARGLCQRDYMRAKRCGTLAQFTAPARLCAECGIDFETGSRAFNRFCSRGCQRANVDAERVAARAADLVGRACAWCGAEMPTDLRGDAIHCSDLCRSARWYAENAEHVQSLVRAWRAANPDRLSESEHRRRARVYATAIGPIDYQRVWERDTGCCWICEKPVDRGLRYPDPMSRSWDHVIPLAAGGSHTMSNIALSHLFCNISKHAKVLDRRPAWARLEDPDARESEALAAQPA